MKIRKAEKKDIPRILTATFFTLWETYRSVVLFLRKTI